jgi:hypothetical protein
MFAWTMSTSGILLDPPFVFFVVSQLRFNLEHTLLSSVQVDVARVQCKSNHGLIGGSLLMIFQHSAS